MHTIPATLAGWLRRGVCPGWTVNRGNALLSDLNRCGGVEGGEGGGGGRFMGDKNKDSRGSGVP